MFERPIHFAIRGPSGAGKTTIVERTKALFPGLGLQKQINYTTRAMRPEEIEQGCWDYVPISTKEFRDKKNAGEFIGFKVGRGKDARGRWENQNYGGLAPTENKTVFITDAGGLLMLRDWAQKHAEDICAVFLDADKDVCHQRMIKGRGLAMAEQRTPQYDRYMNGKELCDVILDANQPMERLVEELYKVMSQEIMKHSYEK